MNLNTKKEQLCIETLKEDGLQLKYFQKNQTYPMCLVAIKQNCYALEHVQEQFLTEDLCLEVVKQDGTLIRFLHNPTKKVQLEAVKQNGMAICFIKHPTEEMKWEAIKENFFAMEFIDDTTEEMKFICNIQSVSYRHTRHLIKKGQVDPKQNPYGTNERLFKVLKKNK